jgi:hypothetical protein
MCGENIEIFCPGGKPMDLYSKAVRYVFNPLFLIRKAARQLYLKKWRVHIIRRTRY